MQKSTWTFENFIAMDNKNHYAMIELYEDIRMMIVGLYRIFKPMIIPDINVSYMIGIYPNSTAYGAYIHMDNMLIFNSFAIANSDLERGYPMLINCVDTVVHELFHVKQNIDLVKYMNDGYYRNEVEDLNDICTVNFINDNLDMINNLFDLEGNKRLTGFTYRDNIENGIDNGYLVLSEQHRKLNYEHSLHYDQTFHYTETIKQFFRMFDDMRGNLSFFIKAYKNMYFVINDSYSLHVKTDGKFMDLNNICFGLHYAFDNYSKCDYRIQCNDTMETCIINLRMFNPYHSTPINYVLKPNPIKYLKD